jgi:hypothetical protein
MTLAALTGLLIALGIYPALLIPLLETTAAQLAGFVGNSVLAVP